MSARVLFLAHRLEAELARDQLDLVEVEALVDGHHQPEVLEGEGDDLARRDLEDVGQLGDGDELVDADGLLLALRLLAAHRLGFLAPVITTPTAATTGAATHGAHDARDVRRHLFLIDRAALPLLLATARGLLRGAGRAGATGLAVVATRRKSNRAAG